MFYNSWEYGYIQYPVRNYFFTLLNNTQNNTTENFKISEYADSDIKHATTFLLETSM